jgi:hypothetical protein
MKVNYIIRAGEPLSLDLLVQEGDVNEITGVTAILKKAGPNLSVPPVNSPALASFEVTELASPDLGWNFYLDDSVTLTLAPGYYITNARLDLISGGPLKTDPVTIEIRGTVTA